MPSSIIASDLPEFFNTRDFGTVFTYAGTSYNGIVSDRFFSAGDDQTFVERRYKELVCSTSVGLSVGVSIAIDGIFYLIGDIESENGVDTSRLDPQ